MDGHQTISVSPGYDLPSSLRQLQKMRTSIESASWTAMGVMYQQTSCMNVTPTRSSSLTYLLIQAMSFSLLISQSSLIKVHHRKEILALTPLEDISPIKKQKFIDLFTDTSDRKGVVGIGITHLSRSRGMSISKTVGNTGTLSVHTAELIDR